MELKEYIGEKIKYFRLLNKMTQQDLADKLFTTKQTVSRYEKGQRSADQDVLFELCDIFNISINEFFPKNNTNELTFITTPPLPSTVQQIVDTTNQLQAQRQDNVLQYAQTQLKEQNNIIKEDRFEYRVHERLSAGVGQYIEQDLYEEYDIVYYDKEIDYDIASWVVGDSMEPTYQDGEVALIKKTGFDYDGAVYAVVWNEKTYIKRVYKEKNHLRLESLNKKYSDKYAPYEEEPRVIGLVVGHFMPMER